MKNHEDAVVRICEHLRDIQNKGMYMNPKQTGLTIYTDADFAGGFMKGHTDNLNTAKSRSSYYIMYNKCLIYWNTKL